MRTFDESPRALQAESSATKQPAGVFLFKSDRDRQREIEPEARVTLF